MHHDDRKMSALGTVTDQLVTTPILLRKRRSVGCFIYPSGDMAQRIDCGHSLIGPGFICLDAPVMGQVIDPIQPLMLNASGRALPHRRAPPRYTPINVIAPRWT